MPIPQIIRVNPLDLQGNIAIGVSLPFNGPAGPFNSTYSTKDQIKSNLINLILTSPGERIMNPEFGCRLREVLFENITDNINELITNNINTSIFTYIPEIESTDITIDTSKRDNNLITIIIRYKLTLSQETDQITLQFV
jgi:phage baseplate assembly protein W